MLPSFMCSVYVLTIYILCNISKPCTSNFLLHLQTFVFSQIFHYFTHTSDLCDWAFCLFIIQLKSIKISTCFNALLLLCLWIILRMVERQVCCIMLRMLLVMSASPMNDNLLRFWSSSLLHHLRKQKKMAQSGTRLPLMWEIKMECQVLDSTKPSTVITAIRGVNKWNGIISASPLLCLSKK